MTNESAYPPRFIDGVEKLHHQLYETHLKASKLANLLLGKPEPRSDRTARFHIYVDFEETHSENKIKGYFTYKNTVLRFLPIEFDYALLFPVKNHGGGMFKQASGISFSEIQQAKTSRRKLFFRFTPIRVLETENNKIMYDVKMVDKPVSGTFGVGPELDDIGLPYYNFTDIEKLAIEDTPSEIKDKHYSLVGKQFYAPLTRGREFDCVLFAQLDNEYDDNAIKVLRWMPVKKGIEVDQLLGMSPDGGDVFFELGYIARTENADLHRYMINNNARLLFGKINGSRISIEGGIKLFMTTDVKYPKCLYNINIE